MLATRRAVAKATRPFADIMKLKPNDIASTDKSTLDELWAWCTRDDFVYVNHWQPGDLLVWDNRSTLHRRDSFDNSLRRILWRCQVKGAALPAAAAA